MNLDEFTRRIEGIGQQLNNVDSAVLRVMSPIVNRVQANAPRDTGALKNSIQIVAQSPTEFYLEMLAYGFFQNYGVKASPDSTTAYNTRQDVVEEQARFGLPPSSGSIYQFGTRKEGSKPWGAFYSGLNAVGFFNMNQIATELTEGLQQELNNTIQ